MLTTVGNENVLPATNNDGTSLRTAAGAIRDFSTEASLVMVGDVAITNSNTAPSYAGLQGANVFNGFVFDVTGDLAANSYASGLAFQKTTANATGTAFGINTAYVDDGAAVKAWVDSEGLHIAAVPEPSETAMLLAGLGLIGFAARRKARRA
ncbi:MAG: PEP-CTERM sorting domain-containing protein [Dechloromonas sp.]|nr:MAG: PEP-CTERM sorting domain-containing protein [Dechloromonas sp.]